MNPGLLYATGAFAFWGLFPLYFKLIADVAPLEVVLQRSVWSLVFLLAVLAWQRRWGWLRQALRNPRQLGAMALSAWLLSANWLTYVWAVQSGQVIEASLGYFINPLVSVVLGVVILKERLRRMQWAAVAMAAAGVLWLTVQSGRLPWIALVLALCFGFYGLLRKTTALGALEGLTLETMLLAPVMVPALAWWTWRYGGVFMQGDPALIGWILMSGPLTALPLLLFGAGARRLPLATLGLMQYIAPTIQLMLGVWIFHEPFEQTRLTGFVLIWLALLIVSVDAIRNARQARTESN
ncbi:MAG: EamA family transporter RarD [Rubrivivax sp.]